MIRRSSVYAVIATLFGGLLLGCGAEDPREPFDAASASYEERVIHAVQTGDVDKVKGFVAERPDLATMHDSAGKTLLHHAAVASQVEVAEYLLNQSADINAQGYRMETPLDDALGAGASTEMIQFLEARGAED